MDVDKFLKASVDLYYSAPAFFNYSIPILVGGYIAFLFAGYGFGKWVQQSEIAGLKAAADAGKAQNDALKTTNDVLKERSGVLEERVKLAKEQADDATKKAQELRTEVADLKEKIDSGVPMLTLQNSTAHLDVKAFNLLEANTALSSSLTPASLRNLPTYRMSDVVRSANPQT